MFFLVITHHQHNITNITHSTEPATCRFLCQDRNQYIQTGFTTKNHLPSKMVPATLRKNRAALAAAFCLVFLHCAGDIPPSGGPPDTIAPTIIRTVPDSNAVRVEKGVVGLAFSEYVDRRSVEGSIFVSPYVGELEFDWSGKEVEITFAEPLRKHTTYVVNIGTDVKDIRGGNRMAAGYTLAFSTGDSIDHGFISGRVFDEKPEGVMIFAYTLEGRNPDTLNPGVTKPDYITQTGKEGKFTLANLAYGPYRVLAVRDEYRNYVYDKQTDQFGITNSDVHIDEEHQRIEDVWFRLSKEDTAKPFLSSVKPLDRLRLDVHFSEPVDTPSFGTAEFVLSDTAGTHHIPLAASYFRRAAPSNAGIIVQSPLEGNRAYRLRVRNVHDLAGNPLDTTHAAVDFIGNREPDTTKPTFSIRGITDSSKGYLPIRPIEIDFSEPVRHEALTGAIALLDSSKNKLPSSLRWLNPTDALLEPAGGLQYGRWYHISFILDSVVDLAGNRFTDSVRVVKFQTLDLRSTGTIEGSVVDERKDGKGAILLTATSIEPPGVHERTVVLPSPGNFKIDQLVEGKYSLRAFRDADSNGVYSYGSPFPFATAERFVVYPDTLKVRARWGVEGVLLKFKK